MVNQRGGECEEKGEHRTLFPSRRAQPAGTPIRKLPQHYEHASDAVLR